MMDRSRRPILLLLALALLLATPLVSLAQTPDAPDMETENIRVTVRIGQLENGKKVPVKTYQLVVASGTPGSTMLSGQRVPIPTGGADGAVIYQNIGFATNITAWVVDKKAIRVVADIEDSRLILDAQGGLPVVETRQLTVNAMLTSGKAMELARAEGISDKSGYVEIEAERVE